MHNQGEEILIRALDDFPEASLAHPSFVFTQHVLEELIQNAFNLFMLQETRFFVEKLVEGLVEGLDRHFLRVTDFFLLAVLADRRRRETPVEPREQNRSIRGYN